MRQRSGLKADEVGELIGKSGKTVNAWENGRGQPDVDTLILLCDIYGVEDIKSEFDEKLENEQKQENALFLSAKEKNLVNRYREETSMRDAVDRILMVDKIVELPKMHEAKKVARSLDGSIEPTTEYLTEQEISILENCKEDDTL